MNRIAYLSTSYTFIFVISTFLAGCGVSSVKPRFTKNTTPTGPQVPGVGNGSSTEAPNRNCGNKITSTTYRIAWSYTNCDFADTVMVTQSTIGDNKEPLGSRNVNRGRLIFKIKGIHNNAIYDRETFGIIFMANGNGGGEANWQWMSYRMGGPDIESRLVIQRFDGTCPGFCENSYITGDLQFRESSEVTQFDCSWDATAGSVACEVTKPADPTVRVSTHNDTMGAYNSLRYIGVGQGAFDGPYAGYPGTVYDYQVAIFE